MRPAFIIPNLSDCVGSKILVNDTICTVIDTVYALSDVSICVHRFDKATNEYDKSEIKEFINSEEFFDMLSAPRPVDEYIETLDSLGAVIKDLGDEEEAFEVLYHNRITNSFETMVVPYWIMTSEIPNLVNTLDAGYSVLDFFRQFDFITISSLTVEVDYKSPSKYEEIDGFISEHKLEDYIYLANLEGISVLTTSYIGRLRRKAGLI